MSIALAAMLGAVLAIGGGPPGDVLALGGAPPGDVIALGGGPPARELITGALPTPPEVLVRETRTYGTVTIDHKKHLALRAPCSGCHDPGPVTKIVFTPKIAHQRCVGCDRERESGPRECSGCHDKVKPIPGYAPSSLSAGAGAPSPAAGAAQSTGPDAASSPMTPDRVPAAGPGVAPHPVGGPDVTAPALAPQPSGQFLEFGCSAMSVLGPSVRLATRRDELYVAYGVERFASQNAARMLSLLDVGVQVPVRERWGLVGSWIAGIDLLERPSLGLSSVLGMRIRVEWAPPRRWPIDRVHFSIAGIRSFPRASIGHQSADTELVATLGSSIALEGFLTAPRPSERHSGAR
jgi:hypothetical protein